MAAMEVLCALHQRWNNMDDALSAVLDWHI